MIKKSLAFMLVVGLLLAGCSVSQEQLLGQIVKKTQSIDSFYAELEAVVHSPEGKQTYQVKEWQQNPDRWRVEVSSGKEEQHFLCDGESIWVYQPGLKDYYRFDANKGIEELSPPFMLTGYLDELKKAASFTLLGEKTVEGKKAYHVSHPGKIAGETIQLWLDTKTFFPLAFEIYLNDELLSRITVKQLKLNPKHEQNVFEFEASTTSLAADHCIIKPISLDEARLSWPVPVFVPTYLPGDSWLFAISRAVENEREQLIFIYQGEHGFTLIQRQKSQTPANSVSSAKQVQIGKVTGFFQNNSDNKLTTLWWANEQCDFTLSGALPLTEIVKIAASLKADVR